MNDSKKTGAAAVITSVSASGVCVHSLFLMSFSSLRMREDSCSGVGALKREAPPSAPEGGVGSLCLKSSSMLLCSLRFRPYGRKMSTRRTTGGRCLTGRVLNITMSALVINTSKLTRSNTDLRASSISLSNSLQNKADNRK